MTTMKQRSISSFGRTLLGVLFLALCISFVDDELFLKATKEGVSNPGTILKKNNSWTADVTSLLNDWTKDTSSALIDWKNSTSWTASSSLSNWTNGKSVSSMLKKSSDWSNTSVSSVLNDWGVDTSSWDDWEDWFPSASINSSSTAVVDSWNDWGRFFGGKTEASRTSSNKTSLLSWSTPKVSIVIDFGQETEDQSDEWMSRMAFAKMLQIEAHAAHGVDAELVVVGTMAPLTSWSRCFPGIDSEIKVVSDMKELNLKELEQEQWLGEMAVLLEASPDVWQDGLYLLQQHYRAEAARYAGDISLPFLRVSGGSAPALSEWKHIEALIEFMRINPDCCTLPRIKVSEDMEKETIVNLQSSDSSALTVIQPSQLLQLLDRPKWSRIVLVENEPDESVDAYATMLQEKKGYIVQSIHGALSGGSSMEARYCLLQQARHELIGSLDSPSSVWASMTTPNTGDSSPIIRLLGEDKNEVIRQQEMQYATKDPRSRIRIEALPPSLPTNESLSAYSLGNKQHPLSLVVQLAGASLDNILYGYALQHLLRQSYNIETVVLLRRQEANWIKINNGVKQCFPQLANIDVAAAKNDQFTTRQQQLHSMGLAQTFEILTSPSVYDKLAAVQQVLRNTTSWTPLPLPKNATVTASETLITFPYIFLGESTRIQVDSGFKRTFDTMFARVTDGCTQFESNEALWTKVALVDASSQAQTVKDVSERRPEEVNKSIVIKDKRGPERDLVITDSNSLGSPSRPITIVIHLSGEMANHLGKLAYGYSLKWLLQEDYNITAKTVLRHQQRRGKWTAAMKSVKSCFKKMKPLNFEGANTPEYDMRLQQQQKWFHNKFNGWCEDEMCIRDTIREYIDAMSNATNLPLNVPDNATITLPFIESTIFGNFGYINDRYNERLKRLFQFDYGNPKCCSERPAPNETLFHFRGFLLEMPKKGFQFGFEELSPNKTATELLGELNAGDKVAVLGRFASETQPYVDAMKAAGLDARSIATSNGEQSFCFLMAGQREIIGSAKSTYITWAAYLGNASKARLYSIKSPARIKVNGEEGCFRYYNYTDPILSEKMSLETYNSEEQDQIEHQHRKLLLHNEAPR